MICFVYSAIDSFLLATMAASGLEMQTGRGRKKKNVSRATNEKREEKVLYLCFALHDHGGMKSNPELLCMHTF